MVMRPRQIHNAGTLEPEPAMRIQTPKPVIPSEIAWAAAFSMLDPNGNGRSGSMIASKTRIGRKRSAERGKLSDKPEVRINTWGGGDCPSPGNVQGVCKRSFERRDRPRDFDRD
jgi:hypothetical protein